MTEPNNDLEALLRRYRPAGPPPDLRRRVTAPVTRPPWRWVAAAAVLLGAIAFVQAASDRTVARLGTVDREFPSTLEDLTASLGGDERARRLASTVVANQRLDAELARRGSDVSSVSESGR